jgi:hypothetical protein
MMMRVMLGLEKEKVHKQSIVDDQVDEGWQ